MWSKVQNWMKKVKKIFSKQETTSIDKDVQVSDKMGKAIEEWFAVFYNKPTWLGEAKGKCKHQTKFAAIVTNYMSILSSNEINISAGNSALGAFITEQIVRNVLPDMQKNVQLVGVGGSLVLKPYVRGKEIRCERIQADRFYPTRIVGGVVEACFFVDYTKINGKEVVRVEQHDLQPHGLYIHNTVFYKENGAEISLEQVSKWQHLKKDTKLSNISTPLFAVLKMPFPNTIDETSELAVSMYANSMGALQEIDRIYSEFLWEIYTGKRRQIFDRSAIKMTEPGTSIGYKDMASDQYIVLDMEGAAKPYGDYTPEMRIEAYQKALDIQLRLLETQCGISPGTFTFDIQRGTAKTATEVISQDKTTYNTVKSIQDRGLKEALERLIEIYAIYAQLYHLAPAGKIESNVSFGDSIFEDTETEYKRRINMVGSGLLKGEEFVAWYFGIGLDEARELMPDIAQDVE